MKNVDLVRLNKPFIVECEDKFNLGKKITINYPYTLLRKKEGEVIRIFGSFTKPHKFYDFITGRPNEIDLLRNEVERQLKITGNRVYLDKAELSFIDFKDVLNSVDWDFSKDIYFSFKYSELWEVSFRSIHFKDYTSFTDTMFLGKIIFDGSHFKNCTRFHRCKIYGTIEFNNVEFEDATSFFIVQKSTDYQCYSCIEIKNSKFGNSTNFDTVSMNSITIKESVFGEDTMIKNLKLHSLGVYESSFGNKTLFYNMELGEISLRGSKFKDFTSFVRVVFLNFAIVSGMDILAKAAFAKESRVYFGNHTKFIRVKFNQGASFKNIQFGGTTVFHKVDFGDYPSTFDESFLGANLEITDSDTSTSIYNHQLEGNIVIKNVRIGQIRIKISNNKPIDLHLDNVKCYGLSIVYGESKGNSVRILNSEIKNGFDIEGDIYECILKNTKFNGILRFGFRTTIEKLVVISCDFFSDIFINGVAEITSISALNIYSCTFRSNVRFESVIIGKKNSDEAISSIETNKYNQEVSISHSNFMDKVFLASTKFNGSTLFDKLVFSKDVALGAYFNCETVFNELQFMKRVSFYYTHFLGKTRASYVEFKGEVDWRTQSACPTFLHVKFYESILVWRNTPIESSILFPRNENITVLSNIISY